MKARNMNSRGIFGYDGIYVNIVHRSKELKETINVITDEVVTVINSPNGNFRGRLETRAFSVYLIDPFC